MWTKLLEVLGEICTTYDNLATLGERKRDALITIDMKALAKILDEEELAAAKIQKLEKQRGAIYSELAKTVPNLTENTKAEVFYQNAPSLALERRLISLHKMLTKNVQRAMKLRDNNQILANAALSAVQYHLNRLTVAQVGTTYGKAGENVSRKRFEFEG